MSIKQEVLDVIKYNNIRFFSLKDILRLFSNSSYSRSEIDDAVGQLINEGEIMFSKSKMCLPKTLGIIKGTLSVNPKGFGFLRVQGEEDYFVSPKNFKGAMHGDLCLAQVLKVKAGKTEAKIQKILTRGLRVVVGTFEDLKNYAYVKPDDERILKDVYIDKNYFKGAKNGQKVVAKLVDWGNDGASPEGEIIEVLGFEGEKFVDMLSVIRAHELFEEFAPEVLKEADNLPDSVNEAQYPNRKKFYKDVITIDGEDARDFDDAITLYKEGENYRLYVHIADVAEYVKQNSAIDREAFNRGTSVYFPHMVLPMLPVKLSNGICSLNEGVLRLALTCEILVSKSGKILTSDVYESIIKSTHRMTYTGVTKILNGDEMECKKYADVVPMLNLMNELGKILFEMRKKRGALDFDIPEPYIIVDENGKTVDIIKRPREDSDKIIESFMICANEAIAEKFFNLEIPFVYRVHEKPDEEKVYNFIEWCGGFGETFKLNGEITNEDLQKFMALIDGKPYEQTLNKLALRTMQKAKYSDMCMGHFGLASTYYCHFTSPIRRYPDLTIHRIIKWFLNNQLYNKNMAELEEMVIASSVQSSKTEKEAEEAEREVDDMKKAEYMIQFIGSEFEGTVSSVTNFGIFVELDNTVEGLVRLESINKVKSVDEIKQCVYLEGGVIKLGDKVKVLLTASDPRSKKIDFELVND